MPKGVPKGQIRRHSMSQLGCGVMGKGFIPIPAGAGSQMGQVQGSPANEKEQVRHEAGIKEGTEFGIHKFNQD